MGIFQQFPYSNFHEFNLDEIIKIMRQMQDEWEATKTEWASYKDFIDNYFENLDLNAEVYNAIFKMANEGSLNPIIDPVIVSETADWLSEHITQPTSPVVDTSLSIAGAAADAKVTGDKIGIINKELVAENFFDIITPLPKQNVTRAGVTYTWLDENTCGVSGTSTGTAFCSMFTEANSLPFGMEAGKTYQLKFSSTRVILQIWFYINGVATPTPQIATRNDEIFTVPNDATGVNIRFVLYTGQTAAETVKVRILTRDINDYFSNLGYLPSSDMDDLSGNVLGILSNHETYTNAPFAIGMIYNIDVSPTIQMQYGFQFTTGQLFYRRKSTTWGPWRDLTNQNAIYLSPAKYVAFGESVTWGAVWNAQDDGQPYHRVKIDWQIPTRIAVAIGMANNFVNMGIGGIGFVHKEDNVNIVDVIKAYDFSNTEIITVMGGGNDKARANIPFGSRNSVAGDGSVCGAIIDILEYMKTNWPKVQVIFLQPAPSAAATMIDVWGASAAGGWSMNDFETEVSAICHAHHAGYAGWWECAYCDNWARYNIGYSSGTGPNYSHPVVDFDYCILGDFIGGKVSALFHSLN